jgi:hypothetical protein
MSIETQKTDSYFVIRLVSDMVMESDVSGVKNIVEQALKTGIKRFVFSVSIGSLANRMAISRLILWCNQTIKHHKGQMLFVEKNPEEASVFGTLCESLKIPICRNQDTAVIMREKTRPESNQKSVENAEKK